MVFAFGAIPLAVLLVASMTPPWHSCIPCVLAARRGPLWDHDLATRTVFFKLLSERSVSTSWSSCSAESIRMQGWKIWRTSQFQVWSPLMACTGTCSAEVFGADLQPMEGPSIVGGIASMITKKVFTTIIAAGRFRQIPGGWWLINQRKKNNVDGIWDSKNVNRDLNNSKYMVELV